MSRDYLKLAPVEITQDNFNSAYKALPPIKHTLLNTTESFFFGDKQTESIYPVFARVFNRFFKLYATEDTQHPQIVNLIMTSWIKREWQF